MIFICAFQFFNSSFPLELFNSFFFFQMPTPRYYPQQQGWSFLFLSSCYTTSSLNSGISSHSVLSQLPSTATRTNRALWLPQRPVLGLYSAPSPVNAFDSLIAVTLLKERMEVGVAEAVVLIFNLVLCWTSETWFPSDFRYVFCLPILFKYMFSRNVNSLSVTQEGCIFMYVSAASLI